MDKEKENMMMRDFMGFDDKSLEKKEKKAAFEVLQKTKGKLKQEGREWSPDEHRYDHVSALNSAFGSGKSGDIHWLNTETGKRYMEYLEEWKNQ